MFPYHYPDFDDHLVGIFLERFEKNEIYWRDSENRIISLIFSYLKSKPGFGFNSFLDAGCGKGRLLETFSKLFQKIVAVEPDPDRHSHAAALARNIFPENMAEVINIEAEEFRSNQKFDLILCSHVIQHIHTDTVIPLINNLGNHLTDKGVIALTTCHSTTDTDNFRKDHLTNGKPVREPVEKGEFNSLIECKGGLPIHFFNADNLISDLEEEGFTIPVFRVFHVSKEDREQLQIPDIDTWANSDTEIQKRHGIDMLLLLERNQ